MMKKILELKGFIGLMAILLLVGTGSTFAQRPTLKKKTTVRRKVVRPVAPLYTVAAGTVVRSRMDSTLTSDRARVGDTFTATVTEPVYSTNGVVVVPVGSTLRGRVNMVRPAAKGGKPGQIDASFVSLRLPNGRSRAINGSLTDLTGSTKSDNEGTATGKAMKNRKLIFIGGGGAGGAILGAAIGGGKGALVGALLGGGGGFLGQKLTKGSEAKVESGTEFGVYLNQSIAMPRFTESGPMNQ